MKKTQSKNGFTLIELLTVIAIIAMLMAIFGMGAKKMKVIQRNLQQKAVFHGMEIGLELFSKDFDGYPGSEKIDQGGSIIVGAQRLQEALFGRDERGFHPRTKWHPDRDLAAMPQPPYPGADLYTEKTEKDRKGPYMELKRGGIYTIQELWGNPTSSVYPGVFNDGTKRSSVITDVFGNNLMELPNGEYQKVGTPILYYKADSTKRFRVDKTNKPAAAVYAEYKDWIFNYDDNHEFLKLNWLQDNLEATPTGGLQKHYKDSAGVKSNEQMFYESITERQEDMNNDGTDDFFRAFNPSTYLLISAGYDGIYGTDDDITNFNY